MDFEITRIPKKDRYKVDRENGFELKFGNTAKFPYEYTVSGLFDAIKNMDSHEVRMLLNGSMFDPYFKKVNFQNAVNPNATKNDESALHYALRLRKELDEQAPKPLKKKSNDIINALREYGAVATLEDIELFWNQEVAMDYVWSLFWDAVIAKDIPEMSKKFITDAQFTEMKETVQKTQGPAQRIIMSALLMKMCGKQMMQAIQYGTQRFATLARLDQRVAARLADILITDTLKRDAHLGWMLDDEQAKTFETLGIFAKEKTLEDFE